ncbi:MAG: hypothetical protein O7C59_04860, partial [Rickettsia endosymbiont of Ixodes persulcatus]|nr:hypothetical protein [Rickettsia endosymbiont of Ixodes persulcatus]
QNINLPLIPQKHHNLTTQKYHKHPINHLNHLPIHIHPNPHTQQIPTVPILGHEQHITTHNKNQQHNPSHHIYKQLREQHTKSNTLKKNFMKQKIINRAYITELPIQRIEPIKTINTHPNHQKSYEPS